MRRHLLFAALAVCGCLAAGRAAAADDDRDFTLVVTQRWVTAVGPGGKELWKFETFGAHIGAGQILSKERVLLASSGGKYPTIAEKDSKGKVLWVKEVGKGDESPHGPYPVQVVQRLADGSTVFAQATRVVQVDAERKEKVLYKREPVKDLPFFGISDAVKFPDGMLGVLTGEGFYRVLDAKGEEITSYRVADPGDLASFARMPPAPDGTVLVAKWGKGTVERFDLDGKTLWSAEVETPNSLMALPGGGALVASSKGKCAVELSPAGKVVWRYDAGEEVFLALRPPAEPKKDRP